MNVDTGNTDFIDIPTIDDISTLNESFGSGLENNVSTLTSSVSATQHVILTDDADLHSIDENLLDVDFMDIVAVPMDSRYIQHIIDELWSNVSDRTFDEDTTNHPMFDLVFNRLETVNYLLSVPRSVDELRLISQHIVTSYSDERSQELLYFILQ